MNHKRVVITGLGAVSALGEGAELLWQAVREGRSAIGATEWSDGSFKSVAAYWQNFEPEKFVQQRKALKVMARDIQLACAAASLAVTDAGLTPAHYDHERAGVIVGSGVLNHELDELGYSIRASVDEKGNADLKRFGEEGLNLLFPLWLLKYLPNMPACHISILFDLQGPSNTLTTGVSSGLQAVGEAYRIIQRADADVMLAGGAESKVNPVGISQYRILGALSEVNGHDPKAVYRPFDSSASGFVVGEGSGFLVLEELEHARKRGARIYAEIAGFGSSYFKGQRTAIRSALAESALKPNEIQYVQSSGLGLPEEDIREAEAIAEVFGAHAPELLVHAAKPVMGFTGFSSGPLELILSVLAMRDETAPATLNFETPITKLPFKILKGGSVKTSIRAALTNSFGFHGQCASLITKRVTQ